MARCYGVVEGANVCVPRNLLGSRSGLEDEGCMGGVKARRVNVVGCGVRVVVVGVGGGGGEAGAVSGVVSGVVSGNVSS